MLRYIKDNSEKFVNPYNFISIDKEIDVRTDQINIGNNTGILHCSLLTKTPLAIPDTETVTRDDREHPTYKFMRLNGKPAIPGSSIRGALRSTYETLTNSCFVTLDSTGGMLSARVQAKRPYNAGILKKKEDNTWELYGATRYRLRCINGYRNKNTECRYISEIDCNGNRYIIDKTTGEEYRNGDYVGAVIDREQQNCQKIYKKNEKDYVLYVGEPIFNKKNESVFEVKERKKYLSSEIEDALERLENTLLFYRNKAINKGLGKDVGAHTGYKNFDNIYMNGSVIPIWYSEENGHLYFSFACIGRKTYENRVSDLIGENRIKCKSRENLCPACRMFGMAGKGGKDLGIGSRIKITDALAVEGSYKFKENVTIKELGSPRTSYRLFYSKNGEEYDAEGTEINGRKYYWHIPQAASNASVYSVPQSIDRNKTERNMTCELIDKQSVFTFDIYYENLTTEELKQLIWLVTLGENRENSNYCYKIGHGRPLGLGSAKICITSMASRNWNVETGYELQNKDVDAYIEDGKLPMGFSKKIKNELYKICNYSFLNGANVRYPYIKCDENTYTKLNDKASHRWFSANKKMPLTTLAKGNKKQDFEFPVYKLDENASSNNYRNSGNGNNRNSERNHKSVNNNGYSKKGRNNKSGRKY